MPGILNWAIAGMDDLERNRGFIQPVRNAELLAQYRRDCDPARAFLEENYSFFPNATGLAKQGVYDAYRHFCERSGNKPQSKGNFSKTVYRTFPGCTSVRGRDDESRVQIYGGLIATSETCVPWSTEDGL